jgi:GST-like protein
MIDLYSWPTPNGHKVSIALEELGLEYRTIAVDISAGEQFEPRFLEISPNNRIPAIVDHAGPGGAPCSLFESGAILMYLAEKAGQLMPPGMADRYEVIQWLMFQMANIGPMFGQAGHFLRYAPDKIPYAIDRYTRESRRLCRVMDGRLARAEYLAGAYSIADIACFPWIRTVARSDQNAFDELPNLRRWFRFIAERPAVQRGLEVPDPTIAPGALSPKARDVLFGDTQHRRR